MLVPDPQTSGKEAEVCIPGWIGSRRPISLAGRIYTLDFVDGLHRSSFGELGSYICLLDQIILIDRLVNWYLSCFGGEASPMQVTSTLWCQSFKIGSFSCNVNSINDNLNFIFRVENY